VEEVEVEVEEVEVVMGGAWSRLMLRPSSSIRALVFLVLGEVTPSWSSFTRGSAGGGFRLGGPDPVSPAPAGRGLLLGLERGVGPGPDLGLELLEVNGSEPVVRGLGRGADNDDADDDGGLEVSGALLVCVLPSADELDSLEWGGPCAAPEPRPALDPPWWWWWWL